MRASRDALPIVVDPGTVVPRPTPRAHDDVDTDTDAVIARASDVAVAVAVAVDGPRTNRVAMCGDDNPINITLASASIRRATRNSSIDIYCKDPLNTHDGPESIQFTLKPPCTA